MDKKLFAKFLAHASIISSVFSLGGIQTALRLKKNSATRLLCTRNPARDFWAISLILPESWWHILLPLLYGLRNKDSERLTDSPQVSMHTTGCTGIWARSCLAPKHLGPSNEHNCPCSVFLHTLGTVTWTRIWQTSAWCSIPTPTSPHPREAARLLSQITRRRRKDVTHELISAEQMGPLG